MGNTLNNRKDGYKDLYIAIFRQAAKDDLTLEPHRMALEILAEMGAEDDMQMYARVSAEVKKHKDELEEAICKRISRETKAWPEKADDSFYQKKYKAIKSQIIKKLTEELRGGDGLTNQEKKAYLRRYTDLDKAINQKLDELSRLKSLCQKCTTTYSGMPKGGPSDKSDIYVKMIDNSTEIDGLIDSYVDMRRKIEQAINTVQDITLKTLLRYRYIEGLTWEEIAVCMSYAKQWVLVLHGRALSRLNCCL